MKSIKHPLFLLFLILCIAFLIRTINFKDNFLFAYDQARDAQRVYNMVYKGDLKIVGPETDIQGIFNGPLLYYVLAPIYYFSHFDPNAAALLFVVINVGAGFLVYWAAKILFNKNSIALLASLLWAVSYEQGFFARFISNASFMSLTTTIFFVGLALFFLKKKQWGLILSAIGIALSIHSNFFFIYLFLFYPLFFFIYRQKPSVKTIGISFLLLGILLSPWVITELRWHFIGTRSLFAYFLHQGSGVVSVNGMSFIEGVLKRYYERIGFALSYSFIPSKSIGFAIIGLFSLYLLIKKRSKEHVFLLLWMFHTFPLFVFQSGVLTVEVINQSIFIPLTILTSYFIYHISYIKLRKVSIISLIVVVLIIGYNVQSYSKDAFAPVYILSSHRSIVRILLKSSKELIDYTYKKSENKEFALCSISEPLFINTVWSFLYGTYGKQKYGYLPYWTGQKQTLNENFIPYAHKKYQTKFIILEPMFGIPSFAPRATYYIEDKQNTVADNKSFGSLKVQQRLFVKNNGGNIDKYPLDLRKTIERDIGLVPQFSCDNVYE